MFCSAALSHSVDFFFLFDTRRFSPFTLLQNLEVLRISLKLLLSNLFCKCLAISLSLNPPFQDIISFVTRGRSPNENLYPPDTFAFKSLVLAGIESQYLK